MASVIAIPLHSFVARAHGIRRWVLAVIAEASLALKLLRLEDSGYLWQSQAALAAAGALGKDI